MAVAHRASAASGSVNPTTTWTVVLSASIAAGDDLYVAVTSRDHTAGTAYPTVTDNDAGGNTWARIGESSDRKATLWWKKATSGTASKTVTVAGCVGSSSGGYSAYSGGAVVAHKNISAEDNAAANETHAGFTPDCADSFIVLVVFNYGNDDAVTAPACTTPGALANRFEKLSTGGSDCACNFSSAQQSGGPTATGNFTWSQANNTSKSIVFSIAPPITGTASEAVSSLASSASGSETFSGTSSAAVSSLASAASGAETFTGTASEALSPLVTSGTGEVVAHAGAASVALASLASSVSGSETFTGTASAAVSPLAESGAGTESFSGSEAAAVSPLASSASGAETFTGTAAVAVSGLALTLAGSETFTGTGASALSALASAAAGTETLQGAVSVALSTLAVAAAGSEDYAGTATAGLSPLASDGLGAETFTGAVAAAVSSLTVDASSASDVTGEMAVMLSSLAILASYSRPLVGPFGVAIVAPSNNRATVTVYGANGAPTPTIADAQVVLSIYDARGD